MCLNNKKAQIYIINRLASRELQKMALMLLNVGQVTSLREEDNEDCAMRLIGIVARIYFIEKNAVWLTHIK